MAKKKARLKRIRRQPVTGKTNKTKLKRPKHKSIAAKTRKSKSKLPRREPATAISFQPTFVPHPGELGLPSNAFLHPEDIAIESICGGVDDSQPVEQYDGTLGVGKAFVDRHQGSVGQLQWNDNLSTIYTNPGNVSGVRWCSGIMISKDHFLTAGHCFDQGGGGWSVPMVNGTSNPIPSSEIATNMHVNFNYQVDTNGNMRTEQSFPIIQLVEYRLGALDYAIVRLQGDPGLTYGITGVSLNDANIGDMVAIIGHPAGLPKRIEAGPVSDFHDNRIGYNSIDTLGGNSGSGIVSNSDGVVVGVHTNGGCDAAMVNHNHGQRISSLIRVSPFIKDQVCSYLRDIIDGLDTEIEALQDEYEREEDPSRKQQLFFELRDKRGQRGQLQKRSRDLGCR